MCFTTNIVYRKYTIKKKCPGLWLIGFPFCKSNSYKSSYWQILGASQGEKQKSRPIQNAMIYCPQGRRTYPHFKPETAQVGQFLIYKTFCNNIIAIIKAQSWYNYNYTFILLLLTWVWLVASGLASSVLKVKNATTKQH